MRGCIVDAMGCQKEIAQGISLLAVKENQGRLYQDILLFEGAGEWGFDGVPHDYATTLADRSGGNAG